MKINYEAIRALNPNGYSVQSDDGENWEVVNGTPNKLIVFHVNHNGTMVGPYTLSLANITVDELLQKIKMR